MKKRVGEGENPVSPAVLYLWCVSTLFESRTLELVRKKGGNFLLKLNNVWKPIANKYREGKVKRTLERELKVPEIVEREASETSCLLQDCHTVAQRLMQLS